MSSDSDFAESDGSAPLRRSRLVKQKDASSHDSRPLLAHSVQLLEQQLFAGHNLAQPVDRVDDDQPDSDQDSINDFIVRDPREPTWENATLSEGDQDMDDDILADVTDIFGDLRPLTMGHKVKKSLMTPTESYAGESIPLKDEEENFMKWTITEKELVAQSAWIVRQLERNRYDLLRSIADIRLGNAVIMFLRDRLIRNIHIDLIPLSLAKVKYSAVLSPSIIQEIDEELHPKWLSILQRRDSLNSLLSRLRTSLNDLRSKTGRAYEICEYFQLGRVHSNIVSTLEVHSESPDYDFEDVIDLLGFAVSNFLVPMVDMLMGKSKRKSNNCFSNVTTFPLEEVRQFCQRYGMDSPHDFPQLLSGRFPSTIPTQSFDISPDVTAVFCCLTWSDLHILTFVQREYVRRLMVNCYPKTVVAASEKDYSYLRMCSRPWSTFADNIDFVKACDLAKNGRVDMFYTLVDRGRLVAELVTSQELPNVAANVRLQANEHTIQTDTAWVSRLAASLSLMHVSSQEDATTEIPENFAKENLTADPILQELIHRSGTSANGYLPIVQVLKSSLSRMYIFFLERAKTDLLNKSQRMLAANCADKLGETINVASFQPSIDLNHIAEWRHDVRRAAISASLGFFSAVGLAVERLDSQTVFSVVVADEHGKLVVKTSFSSLFNNLAAKEQRALDESRFVEVLNAAHVSAVVAGPHHLTWSRKFVLYLSDLISRSSSPISRQASIIFGSAMISSKVASSVDFETGVENLSYSFRLALSLCRFAQHPLAEALALWSANPVSNTLLSVILHPLQHCVDRNLLHATFLRRITTWVSDIGVDLNDLALSTHRRSMLQFIPGVNITVAQTLTQHLDSVVRGIDKVGSNGQNRSDKLGSIIGQDNWLKSKPFIVLRPDISRLLDVLEDSHDRLKSPVISRMPNSIKLGHSLLALSLSEILTSMDHVDATQLLRLPSECRPVLNALPTIFSWPSLAFAIGREDLRESINQLDLDSFAREMLNAEDAPDFLADSEVDLETAVAATAEFIRNNVLNSILAPITDVRKRWKPLSHDQIFLESRGMLLEFPNELAMLTARVVKEDPRGPIVRLIDWGVEATVVGLSSSSRFREGEMLLVRIRSCDFERLTFQVSIDAPSIQEVKQQARKIPFSVFARQDLDCFQHLGKIQDRSAAKFSKPRARRVIRHDSFFEIDHSTAVLKLRELPVGEVIFRPSKSSPGTLVAMVKISEANSSRDPKSLDWIRSFTFAEETSRASGAARNVYRASNDKEEFEELDQIKAVFIERYLRFLHEFTTHSKYRPESLEQVRNLLKVVYRTDGSVVYHFALEERPALIGNGVLLWAHHGKVSEDPVQITSKGFKLWNRGPFGSLHQLIAWWKAEGFQKRVELMRDFQDYQVKLGKRV